MNSSTIRHLQEVDSTNSEMKRWLGVCPDLLSHSCVYADFQISGRGQIGNSWESERNANILMSILYRPTEPMHVRRQFDISMAAALAVKSTIEAHLPSSHKVSVKWPNDVYVDERKICGILIENTLSGANIGYSIVGIGLNINQKEFISNAPNPISLYQLTLKNYDEQGIREELQRNFIKYSNYIPNQVDTLHNEYINSLFRADGNFHPWALPSGETIMAKIIDTLSTGYIVLETETGQQSSYAFKEISHIIKLPNANLLT
ncbi:MAG: biotin--[acetyl-CoA-carboxylase] ligase [Bacteroidia bacterium]|nr:biotin--[acetyl-CoA-carboxylase] ligase [Bacteroidia bacterium]